VLRHYLSGQSDVKPIQRDVPIKLCEKNRGTGGRERAEISHHKKKKKKEGGKAREIAATKKKRFKESELKMGEAEWVEAVDRRWGGMELRGGEGGMK